jgi:hypothetical protein
MKFDPIGRRLFLGGAGALLALPLLPSLLPRGVRAQTAGPIRYIQVLNPYGASTSQFYGSLTMAETVAPGVGGRPLSDVSGDISALIGPDLSALRHKLSLIHGMDVIIETANHHLSFPTCASGYASGLDGDEHPPVSGQASVDVLMAGSSHVYGPETPAARRLLTLNPVDTDNYTRTRSFSWQETATGEVEMIRPTKTTLGLMDLLATGFGEAAEVDANETLLLDAVYEDYRKVRDGSRISADDRARLEAYMALIQDVARGRGTCTMPTFDEETDIDVVVSNQIKLLAAALTCDLTRVVSVTFGMSEGYDVRHTEHHDLIATRSEDSVGLYRDLVTTGRRVGELVRLLDSTMEGDGTLLDNSIVYWSMQYGNARPGDSHRATNMPVMVAGSAGGQLETGYYLDYRKDGHLGDHDARGIPLNNLLVTFMNCMGLSSEDYEPEGRAGYGHYNDAFFGNTNRPDTDYWSSSDGRRAPLPFFYRGTERG